MTIKPLLLCRTHYQTTIRSHRQVSTPPFSMLLFPDDTKEHVICLLDWIHFRGLIRQTTWSPCAHFQRSCQHLNSYCEDAVCTATITPHTSECISLRVLFRLHHSFTKSFTIGAARSTMLSQMKHIRLCEYVVAYAGRHDYDT